MTTEASSGAIDLPRDLVSEAGDFLSVAIDLRRDIHAEPELGLQNPATRDKILAALAPLDLEIHRCNRTSGLALRLEGKGDGPAILLRADTDALPMPEETDLDYRSKTDGRMHACGHDAHTAMLVGAAHLLDRHRDDLPGDVILVFQPGEEGHFGAREMIDGGLFEGLPKIGGAFAIHVEPTSPSGMVITKAGPMLSAADVFEVDVIGRGGHASMPHTALDPIPIACEIVLALQSMVTRRINAFDPVVMTIGKISAGTTSNVIPEKAEIVGTLRSTSERSRTAALEGLQRVATGIAAAHDAEAEVRIHQGYPATINDAGFTDFVRDTTRALLGERGLVEMPTPVMGAEDFCYFLERAPGTMVFLGARVDSGPLAPCHSNRMVLDEGAMATGIALHTAMALRFGNASSN